MKIFPVILCGGAGQRLWPASSQDCPKPFLRLMGERSLLQETASRVAGGANAATPTIVVAAAHAETARRQLLAEGVDAFIITEPEGRNSGPALIAAACWIARTDPDGVILAVASDHRIADGAAFRAGVDIAAAAAAGGSIVTFGVKPTHPATAYGYIQPTWAPRADPGVRLVEAFIEKPDAARAAALIEAGALWNSGNFVFRAGAILAEAARHAPEMLRCARLAVEDGTPHAGGLSLGPAFQGAPSVSIDVAILEKTDKAAVLPIDYAWSDVGSWEEVWRATPRDDLGNAVTGEATVVDSTDCLIRAGPGRQVVAVGLRNLAIVVEGDKILVCDLAASQDLKGILEGEV